MPQTALYIEMRIVTPPSNQQTPPMGLLTIFSTGTYAIIGTTCVESETCYEKYHEKKVMSQGHGFAAALSNKKSIIIPLQVIALCYVNITLRQKVAQPAKTRQKFLHT